MSANLELQALVPKVSKRPRLIRIGLLGCGTVGSEVARRLLAGSPVADDRESTRGLARVAVAHPAKERNVRLPPEIVTGDAFSIVKDPDIDVVVELIGGLAFPYGLLRQAFAEGKSVVTANKEVVAEHGEELAALAADCGVGFFFEGAVGGAVPLVSAVTEAFAGDRILGFVGVLNGTSNFVLSSVLRDGIEPDRAVGLARERGYAEQDATEDLNGQDAARKAAILASLAFGTRVVPDDVFVRGIEELSGEDVQAAHRLGYVTKMVVRADEYAGVVRVSVEPEAVPVADPLAAVDGSSNFLAIRSELAGTLTFTGAGAGGPETASAVLGDIERARWQRHAPRRIGSRKRVLRRAEQPGPFLIRCLGPDRGLEAALRGHLFTHGIAVDRVDVSASARHVELSVVSDFGDRRCIEKALQPLERDGLVCQSVLKIGSSVVRKEVR